MRPSAGAAPAMRFVDIDELLSCVHCGLCQSACPTYVELGTEADSPRGRIHLMRAMEEGRLEPSPEVVRHLTSASVAARARRPVRRACATGGWWRRRGRSSSATARSRHALARRALAAAFTVPWLRRTLLAPARLIAGRRWTRGWLAFAGALPRRSRARRLPAVLEPDGTVRGTAVLVTGCVAETLFGDTNHATAALLRHAGVRVLVPRHQGCCGALPLHLGARDRAATLAARPCAHARRERRGLGGVERRRLRRAAARVRPPAAGRSGCRDRRSGAHATRSSCSPSSACRRPASRWIAPSPYTTPVTWRTARVCAPRFGRCSRRSRACASSSCPTRTPAAAAPGPTTSPSRRWRAACSIASSRRWRRAGGDHRGGEPGLPAADASRGAGARAEGRDRAPDRSAGPGARRLNDRPKTCRTPLHVAAGRGMAVARATYDSCSPFLPTQDESWVACYSSQVSDSARPAWPGRRCAAPRRSRAGTRRAAAAARRCPTSIACA